MPLSRTVIRSASPWIAAFRPTFPDGGVNTQHSTNPVPVAFVSRDPDRWSIRDGELSDVAPTLLDLLGIPVPDRMTGRSLLTRR